MKMRKVFRCPKCGSMEVVGRAWVNPNFPPKCHQDVGWIDEDYEVFCEDCGVSYTDWETRDVELVTGPDGDMVRLEDGTLVPLERWLEDNPVPGDYTTMYGDDDDDDDEGDDEDAYDEDDRCASTYEGD